MFATTADLIQLVPGIEDHNVSDWDAELTQAESDVVRQLKADWWNKTQGMDNILRNPFALSFDPSKLTPAQWTKATVYLAMSRYILPKLSNWRPEGDAFREQIDFYKELYATEIAETLAAGVDYDFNSDGNVDKAEVITTETTRLYR